MKSIGIIPARAGSVRIPGKNICQVFGREMVEWTILSAIKAKLTTIAVSTNDDDVKAICKRHKEVTIVHRPSELARGVGNLEQTCMGDVMNYCGPHDQILLLQPTSPMRGATPILRALELLNEPGIDSVVGVVEDPGIYFGWKIENGRAIALYKDRPRTQDLKLYRETGALYATTGEQWQRTHLRVSGEIAALELHKWEAHDINDLYDLWLGEAIMQKAQLKKFPLVP